MIGTALASLFGLSSAACPPKLKMLTLYPVFPRLRVGIRLAVRFELSASDGELDCALVIPATATEPSTAAPLLFRKRRRSLWDDLEESLSLIVSSPQKGKSQLGTLYSCGSWLGACQCHLLHLKFNRGQTTIRCDS